MYFGDFPAPNDPGFDDAVRASVAAQLDQAQAAYDASVLEQGRVPATATGFDYKPLLKLAAGYFIYMWLTRKF